jgi:hypothetical protein
MTSSHTNSASPGSEENSGAAEFERKNRFVERRYQDGSVDWLWIRAATVRTNDIDCTAMSEEQIGARIEAVKAHPSEFMLRGDPRKAYP